MNAGAEAAAEEVGRMPQPPAAGAPLEVWKFPRGQPMKVLPGPRANPPEGLGFGDPAHSGPIRSLNPI